MKFVKFDNNGLIYQIIKRLIAVVLLFSVLEVGFVLWTYIKDVEGLGQRLLEIQSEEIAKAVKVQNGKIVYNEQYDLKEYIDDNDMAFAVYDRSGRQAHISGYYNLRPSLMPPITSVSSENRRDEFANGFRLRGIQRYTVENKYFWISLVIQGHGMKPFIPVILSELIDHVALPLIPLSLLILIFNIIVVKRTLTPVTQAIEQIDNINPNDLSFRLISPQTPLEVDRLINAMNKALERIENAAQSLHNFTADTAHELRTPLAIMTMEIDKLPEGSNKDKLKNDVESMSRLVKQMLDMAYADALTIPEDAEAKLNDIAAEVIANLMPIAVKNHRSITLKSDEKVCIRGHADAIGRALRNVIENGLRYTPEKSIVEVYITRDKKIIVKDHGPGVPEEQKAVYLERFKRNEKHKNKGTGLGLAIVNRIVEAHGGKLTLENAPEGGSIITMDLASK